jgi:hypothetical protein
MFLTISSGPSELQPTGTFQQDINYISYHCPALLLPYISACFSILFYLESSVRRKLLAAEERVNQLQALSRLVEGHQVACPSDRHHAHAMVLHKPPSNLQFV